MGSLEATSWRLQLGKRCLSTVRRQMTCLALCQCILDLVNLDLAEALDFQQIAASGCVHGGDGEVAIGLELFNVRHVDAMGLECLDANDLTILLVRSVFLAATMVRDHSRRCPHRHWLPRKAL